MYFFKVQQKNVIYEIENFLDICKIFQENKINSKKIQDIKKFQEKC